MDGEFRYERLTWPEIDAAATEGAMVVVPVGSTEDHGYHLPLEVDQRIPEAVAERTAEGRDDALRFPVIPQGYLPHHMDYPGGVTIGWETFVNYCIDVGASLAHHGFERVLFLNGHGSNHHLLEQATRQVNLQYPGVRAAMCSWWDLHEVRETFAEESTAGPRGSGHGGELETSVYAYLYPDRVGEDRREDFHLPEVDSWLGRDLTGRPRAAATDVTMMPWWSTISETGLIGDATAGDPETGEAILAAAVAGLDRVLDDFAAYPIRDVDDHHSRAVADREYDPFRPR
ncbi:MAG: creatininase family protein [Halobacteriaceae archaeon]